MPDLMHQHGFDVDLVLEPRLSARRAWMVAGGAGTLSLLLATALALVLPLKETQVFTVLVDRQTGDAEKLVKVTPTGIEDQEALKQSLLVAYVSDREATSCPAFRHGLRACSAARAALPRKACGFSGRRAETTRPIRRTSMGLGPKYR